MPIINRPAAHQLPPPPEDDRQPEPAAVPPAAHRRPAPARSAKPSLLPWAILALLFGMVLPVAGYVGYQASTEADAEAERSSADVALSIERFKKISSMTSLAKEIYQSNFVALDEASKRPDTPSFTALEIIVNKNRQDLTAHSETLIEVMKELSEMSASMPDAVEAGFDAAIAGAEQNDSAEAARLLKMGRKIVREAPSEGDRTGYLLHAIDNTL